MNNWDENAPEIERLERASAAKLRGLKTPWNWPEIEKRAREIAVDASALPFAKRAQSLELAAAARALDALAQGAPAGGDLARERGIWAGAAFAAGGNFPSASVVMRRTFPRGRAKDAATATLLCALAPAMRAPLRAQTPVAEALDALFRGESEAVTRVWRAWEAVKPQIAPELWQLARAGLESVVEAATWGALKEGASPAPLNFPDGFVAQLSAQIPTLLPPQLNALRGGLLSGENALVALPPGTGKTLLGEFFLAASLQNQPGLAVFLVPYVSLGRGVVAALRAHFPAEVPVHRWLGGWGGDDQSRADERPEIAVMTPERFDALLRAKPEIWAQLRGVVLDEAHTLGAGARGARVEGLLARLRAHQRNGGAARLLLLSAALDQSAASQKWAGVKKVFASSWTPTARRLAFWRADGITEWHAELSGGQTRALGETALAWPHRINEGGDGWARVRRLEPLVWRNVSSPAKEWRHFSREPRA